MKCAYYSVITPQGEWKGCHCSLCFVMTQGCDYLVITTLPVRPYCLDIPHVIMNPEALFRFLSKAMTEMQDVTLFSRYIQLNVYIKGNYGWPHLSDNQVTDTWWILPLGLKVILTLAPYKKFATPLLLFSWLLNYSSCIWCIIML